MSRLTEQEQQEIIRFLEADRPLPEKYRFLLFEDRREIIQGAGRLTYPPTTARQRSGSLSQKPNRTMLRERHYRQSGSAS
jgi:hypothetical protein